MPILAGFPVLAAEAPPDLSLIDTRRLAFRTLDGQYPFPSTGREFFFMPELEGLDMPPTEVVRRRVPGMNGTLLSEIRDDERELFLPLFVASDSSHADYLNRRDALAGLFDWRRVDYRALGGTFDLVADSERGERFLRCVRLSGMSNPMRPGEGAHWAKLGITVLAVQPYWQGEDWSTPTIRVPAGTAWFGAFPPKLGSSVALGSEMPVLVRGDVDTWPTIDLVGPADSVTVAGPGLSLSIPEGLASGETARIVTDPRGRTALFDGVKQWQRVSPQRTFAPLAPGVQELTLVLAGATSSSSARVSGPTLYERPW